MTLQKRNIDNSVKYIHCINRNSSPGESSRGNKPKTASEARKQNKKHSQNNKKFIQKITAESSAILK